MIIKHDNILYVRNINAIGGVETYAYELAKKYKDKDIAVVCKSIAPEQRRRLEKCCRVYVHNDEQIVCKVAIINWDTSIIDYITKDIWKENAKDGEGIYQTIHTDYTHPSQGQVPEDDRIKCYLAITEDIKNKFIKMTGRKNVIVCRNPLKLEEEKRPLIIVSATRLTEEKGGESMLKLANELDRQHIDFIWFIFTTSEYKNNPVWNNQNVIHLPNRLDVGKYIQMADWIVQPSRVEGDSYTFREAVYRGKPIVACELPYFKEIGIKDNVNALFIKTDDSNIEDVARRMRKPLKFNFEPIKDGYDNIIVDGKSTYQEDLKTQVIVKCICDPGYTDLERNEFIKANGEFKTNKIRAEYLEGIGYVKIIKMLGSASKK